MQYEANFAENEKNSKFVVAGNDNVNSSDRQ